MSFTLSDEKVELFSDDATTTQCACLPTPASRHDRFAAEYKLQFGSGRAHDITQKSFLQESSGRGQEDRRGRDQDGRVRPHREERKGSQGV